MDATERGETEWTGKRKLEVVLEGLKGDQPIEEVCAKYDVPVEEFREWETVMRETAAEALEYGIRVRFKKPAGSFRFPTLLIFLVLVLFISFSAFRIYYYHRM